MDIYKLDPNLPVSTRMEYLNSMVISLSGKIEQAKFDRYATDDIYTGAGIMPRYRRDIGVGNVNTGASAFYGWKFNKTQTGYDIWKFTGSISYAHNENNKLYFDGTEITFMGEATSEDTTSFDKVFIYDGSAYTDVTTQAASEGGTDFTLLEDTSDYVYIGDTATFKGIDIDLKTKGSNNTMKVEYSQGAGSWGTLQTGSDSLIDETNNLIRDGTITYSVPTDWTTDTVNANSRYWIRISTTTTPTTAASSYSIWPKASVPNLLALSSDEVIDEDWKWCSYNIPGTGARIYTTIRNAGGASYEGDYYITSTSTSTNKANYFVYNHEYTADFEDSSYDSTRGQTYRFVDGSSSVLAAGQIVKLSAADTVKRACSITSGSLASGAGIGICRYTDAVIARVQFWGRAYNIPSTGASITVGDKLYLSKEPGHVTSVTPTGTGTIRQVIGVANESVSKGADVDMVIEIESDHSIA